MKSRISRTGSCRSYTLTLWLLLCFMALLCWPRATLAQPWQDASYDPAFQHYSGRFLPWHWQWLKAQCYQESRLKPNAVSPVGAGGLCQFMPATWTECQRALGIRADRFNARASILCAAWYNAKLRRTWSAERAEDERRQLVFASYNAGAGHIIKAQRLCSGAPHWAGISPCLPMVTGRHALETVTYVDRIGGWFLLMAGNQEEP